MKKVYASIVIAGIVSIFTPFVAFGATYGKASITADTIRRHYDEGDLKVLVVPGHEPNYGGAEYQSLRERDIVLMIAEELEKLLKQDENIKTYYTRDKNGWTSTFQKYFDKEGDSIAKWVESQKYKTGILAEKGKLERTGSSSHNDAAPDVAQRLYGISKWSNEHGIDIELHLHLNDAPRPDASTFGQYVGFAVYVPDKEYSSAKPSKELGEDLKDRMKSIMSVSNLSAEKHGVIEDQDLIATGSFNTVDAASVLVEYGYIYESQFKDEASQRAFAKKVAKQTYLGLEDFLRKE